MSDKGPKFTFRTESEEQKQLFQQNVEENDMNLSETGRTLLEAYNTDHLLREYIRSYSEGQVSSLIEFYDSEIDALEGIAEHVLEQTRYVEAGPVEEALAELMEGLYDRDEDAVYDAAVDFAELDPGIGVEVARFAGKFAEDYWEKQPE